MRILVIVIIATVFLGCVNKPGWPERDGAKCLARSGFDEATVNLIVQGHPLEEKLQERVEKINNHDVGFLLARNPNLSAARMTRLSKHKNDFVRAGLARNPALTQELVTVLRNDTSHTVWVGLAANPSLDAKTLLEFKKDKGLEWSWFAMNPACPPEIETKIRESNDPDGLYWLKRTKESLRGWPTEKPK